MKIERLRSASIIAVPVRCLAVTWNTVGITSATAASIRVVADILTATALNVWRLRLRPPRNAESPSTSSVFPIMDPVSDALTTPVSPLDKAITARISSAAFPNVAFSNPPIPWPRRVAIWSVAFPIQCARGTMPSPAIIKSATSLCSAGTYLTRIATGNNPISRVRK
jgi:hypothetical protein